MCGLAGIYKLDSTAVDKKNIPILIKALKHRGPDGEGYWINNEQNCALIHTRLSILDLSEKAKQPMSFMEGRYNICLNGEIYNFIELREELKQHNYIFSTESDTEVAVAAYHHWGEKALHKFNGMWAIAIYDRENKTLFLSRDRYGIKPLYYYRVKDAIMFASEVQAIHKVLGKTHPLCEPVLKDIARGGFMNHGSELTYLEDVYVLPAGYNLVIKGDEVYSKQWYTLPRKRVPKKFEEQAKVLKELFKDACKLRLRSDVPIGTCLSGGVDSGSITAIINSFNGEKEERFNHYTHKGFCASFPNSHTDEKDQALYLANQLGSDLDVITVDSPSQDELEKAMAQCDGPMHALAFYPIWLLYRHIRKSGVTVTLDGQGPDEMLGGYRPVKEAMAAAIEMGKPSWLFDVYNTYASQGEQKQFSAKEFVKGEFRNLLNDYKKQFRINTKNRIKKIIGREIAGSHNNFPLRPTIKSEWLSNTFDKSLFTQFFYAPLPGILNQYDRCSMANGVECRMPFMDYRIVEFIFSLPVKSKVGRGYTKRVLREAVKDLLPDQVRLNKNKIGFNAPIVDWFIGPLREFMIETMNTPAFLSSKYFDGKKLRREFLDFVDSEKPMWNSAWKFWGAVHITWWLIRSDENQ